MAFRVEYSAQAEQDLDAILEWLLEQEAGGKRPALVSKTESSGSHSLRITKPLHDCPGDRRISF